MTADAAPVKCLIYTRVSTSGQAESGLGLEAQEHKCRGYAEAAGLVPTRTLTDDGVSGTLAPVDRPAMSQALDMLTDGGATALIATSASRLGRNTVDVLTLAETADNQGWRLIVLDMNIDTGSPTGRLMFTMASGFAQFERDMTSERTREALAALKRRGVRLGRTASDETRRAGAVAYELRAQGSTWQAIADRLTADGYETVSGAAWCPTKAMRCARTHRLDLEAAEAAERA